MRTLDIPKLTPSQEKALARASYSKIGLVVAGSGVAPQTIRSLVRLGYLEKVPQPYEVGKLTDKGQQYIALTALGSKS